jgi:hypothetical protein
MSERKPPVDAALDALVYAPLGFVLEARGLMPKLVERGRNQVTMAKMVGQFAVQQGQVEASKRLGPVQEQVREQVESVLADLGLVARRDGGTPPAAPAAAPAPVADPEPEPPAAPAAPRPVAAALAIPDYDSLAASQVVPRLRALSPAELEDVRAYEASGRARKTILNRIAQIQAG